MLYELEKNKYGFDYVGPTKDKDSYIKNIEGAEYLIVPFYLDMKDKNGRTVLDNFLYEMEVPLFLATAFENSIDYPMTIWKLSILLKIFRNFKETFGSFEAIAGIDTNSIINSLPESAFLKIDPSRFDDDFIVPHLKKYTDNMYNCFKDEKGEYKGFSDCLNILYRNIIYPIQNVIGYEEGRIILNSLYDFKYLPNKLKYEFKMDMRNELMMKRYIDDDLNPVELLGFLNAFGYCFENDMRDVLKNTIRFDLDDICEDYDLVVDYYR